ncbi:MAG: alanine racemase [Chthoniobacterales bacterium]
MNALKTERCWAEIDLSALRHNAAVARARAGREVDLLAVIKANGYGHGITAVAQALADEAQIFGVANLHEALAVRAVVAQPILILGSALPQERVSIVQAGFVASVSSFDEAREFSHYAGAAPALLNCAIDTGMGRMGVAEAGAAEEIKRIAALPNVVLHSVSTHLPSADEDAEFTRTQLARFSEIVGQIRSVLPSTFAVHALPSAGLLAFPESAHQIVRAGLILYGISPIPEFQFLLRPALAWKTRVILVRDLAAGSSVSYGRTFTAKQPMRVATLSVGYGDGWPRALSNRGAAVLIGGRRCPILGRITMDLTVVDVSDLPAVSAGAEVVLIGRQGDEEILASEVARQASTISWEILTGIGSRVTRVYV